VNRSIRVARDEDWPAILEVHRQAFGEEGEEVVRLVEALRADPALYEPSLSFVAVSGGAVAGHVMNTWSDAAGTPVLQLSPLGVLPARQRQGLGSALVRVSLAAVRERGEPALVVEGNPAYYGRFGFVRADEHGLLPPPEALHDSAFQVAILDEARLPQGQVQYPAPFRR
jgi:putative acetyltransferase